MEDKKCPRCGRTDTCITRYTEGEVVCSECGFVFEIEFIDDHDEQRFFSKNCSTNGVSNKDLSRNSLQSSTYYFGNSDEVKLIGRKKQLNFENNPNYNYHCKSKTLSTEKEKKIYKKESELHRIDSELRQICTFFNISKMIYESTKAEVLKLYEYGKINIRSNSSWKLALGLLLNYTLKNKTQSCFSKEEISDYFQCDIDTIKKEAFKIYQILKNSNTISLLENNQKENIVTNKENKLKNYLLELQKNFSFLIKRTKIQPITGICDSYDILYIYIQNNIFNIEEVPPICLVGGCMIFCIKLYNIQFMIKTKNKEVLDVSYSMNGPEEEKKLLNYFSKKCCCGINTDKLKAIYERMRKYKNVLKDNDKFKDFLNNLSDDEKE